MDKDVASVTPTSRFCVRTVCKPIDFNRDIIVVEYGAGAGVFSKYLLNNMTPGSRLYLFETNEILYNKLLDIKDHRVQFFRESVEYVTEFLDDDIIGKVDFIISGIPFSFLKDDQKQSILDQSREILREGGNFLAYQTSGHLKKPLEEAFGKVQTEWEWRNIPPMTVYRAMKES
jgi:phospholipid N-methyltransferase